MSEYPSPNLKIGTHYLRIGGGIAQSRMHNIYDNGLFVDSLGETTPNLTIPLGALCLIATFTSPEYFLADINIGDPACITDLVLDTVVHELVPPHFGTDYLTIFSAVGTGVPGTLTFMPAGSGLNSNLCVMIFAPNDASVTNIVRRVSGVDYRWNHEGAVDPPPGPGPVLVDISLPNIDDESNALTVAASVLISDDATDHPSQERLEFAYRSGFSSLLLPSTDARIGFTGGGGTIYYSIRDSGRVAESMRWQGVTVEHNDAQNALGQILAVAYEVGP